MKRPPPSYDVLLNAKDVAAIFKVHPRTVNEWSRQGLVPCIKTPGGRYRYRESEIVELVENGFEG